MTVWHRELENGIGWLVGAAGRLDQDLTPRLEAELDELLDAGHFQLVVDLSDVTYVNSGGLRCLVSAWRRARQYGGDLVLYGLNTRLEQIFSLVGFDRVFQIFPTLESAQQSIQ